MTLFELRSVSWQEENKVVDSDTKKDEESGRIQIWSDPHYVAGLSGSLKTKNF